MMILRLVEVCNKIEEIRNNNKKLHEQMDALMIKRTEVDARSKRNRILYKVQVYVHTQKLNVILSSLS